MTGTGQAERVHVATKDEKLAWEMMARTWVGHHPRRGRSGGPVHYEQRSVTRPDVGVDTVDMGFDFVTRSDPLDQLLFLAGSGGEAGIRCGGDEVTLRPGAVLVMPVGARFELRTAGFSEHVVRLPAQRIARVAAERTGTTEMAFRFTGIQPTSEAGARRWRRTMAYLHRTLTEPESTPPLFLDAVLDLAAAVAITTFPNTGLGGRQEGAGRVAPAAVRRAVAFIDEHARDRITRTDVAAAAGLSPRGLQYAFERHHGVTPAAYLRRVRMVGAHRELQAADRQAGDTVTAIARRWGFSNLTRFSAAYRRTFDRTPGETLRS
jgi:AraC-like DNA-binding protein